MKEIAVAIFTNSLGEVLLQKKTLDYSPSPGAWCLFGGSIEGTEDPKMAIIREIKEEIGLDTSPSHCFTLSNSFLGAPQKTHVFHHTIEDISRISLAEGAGFAFFGLDELKDLRINSDVADALEKYFSISLKRFN